MRPAREQPPLSPTLFLGFAVASIGGPLALAALYLPGAAEDGFRSAGLTTAVAAALFIFPLLVWYRYSRSISSPGGLYAFTRAAAGRRVAAVQGWIWTVAYFLYLPYTVAYIAYELLPVAFPGTTPYRAALTVSVPVALTAALAFADRAVLAALAVVALVQVGLVVALGGVAIGAVGVPAASVGDGADGSAVAFGSLAVSLLFLCASLPVFLGGEVRGGGRTVRLGLAAAFALVALVLVFVALPLAGAAGRELVGEIPGYTFAKAHASGGFAALLAAFAAASVFGLVVAEFVALSRLLHAMLGRPIRELVLAIGAVFVVLDAVSLVDPSEFYEKLLLPSLSALYVSQLIVFGVYPLFRRRRGELGVLDLAAAAVAAALMGYGLWVLATEGVAT